MFDDDSRDDFLAKSERLVLKRGGAPLGSRFRIDYAADLNDEQLAAVTAGNGAVLVLAGAGSGKTRVITYRVAYLLENGIRPNEILLTTFTNRAAKSMLGRVEGLLNANLWQIVGGTFHSICNRMLRKYAHLIGFSENFTILDEDDARHLMNRARIESGANVTDKYFPSARVLYRIASLLVNTDQELRNLLITDYPQFIHLQTDIERCIAGYAAVKQVNDAMDFDDLLLWMHKLMREHPDVRREIAGKLRNVLVDEYQDTNRLQAELVELWASEHGNMFVVGDDSQSIYSFRGANFKNILTFPDRHPDTRIFKLETNYRSTPEVLTLANEIFRDAPANFRKTLRAVKPRGARPSLVACENSDDQADFVGEKILELREDGLSLNDIAVLYRAHRNSQEIEMSLARRGIPYFIRGGVRFMEMAHVKDLLSYLVIFGAPRNEIAWSRVLLMCNGVGQQTVSHIIPFIKSAYDPIEAFLDTRTLSFARGHGRQSLLELQTFLRDLLAENPKRDPSTLAQAIHQRRYRTYMESQYENAKKREDDIEQFLIYAARFTTLSDMLQEVALHGGFIGAEVAAVDPFDVEEGKVCLSTIHQAKGLEWKAVFVVWLIDGTLPHAMSFDDPDALDEERRLFYVAVTRAKDTLTLTYPQQRSKADFSIDMTQPTRYLKEISGKTFDTFTLEWDTGKGELEEQKGRKALNDGSDRQKAIDGSDGQKAIDGSDGQKALDKPANDFDLSKLGGRMLGGGNPGKAGGVWMPNIGDMPKPGLGEDEEEIDEEFEGLEE